jgi:hypothetical protein
MNALDMDIVAVFFKLKREEETNISISDLISLVYVLLSFFCSTKPIILFSERSAEDERDASSELVLCQKQVVSILFSIKVFD